VWVKKYMTSTFHIGNPEEIASAVSFLASEDCSFVTIELFVHGGIAQIQNNDP